MQPMTKTTSYEMAYSVKGVVDLIKSGYEPYGDPMPSDKSENGFCQAMVKKEPFRVEDYIEHIKPMIVLGMAVAHGATAFYNNEEIEKFEDMFTPE